MKINVVKHQTVTEEIEVSFPMFRKRDGALYFFRDENFCFKIYSNGGYNVSKSGYFKNEIDERSEPATRQEFLQAVAKMEKEINEMFKSFTLAEYNVVKEQAN